MLLLNDNTTIRSYIETYVSSPSDVEDWKTGVFATFGAEFYNNMWLEILQQYANQYWVYRLNEYHIYGSSRLGLQQRNTAKAAQAIPIARQDPEDEEGVVYYSYTSETVVRVRGQKRYELSNHLGNVLAVITDRRLQSCDADELSYYEAEVVSVTDYYPFGMEIKERSWSVSSYRYGFNTQEKVDEIKGAGNHYTAPFWEMDPRLGRRWNLDPKPQVCISDYAIFRNNPIWFTDVLGDSSVWDNKGYMIHYDPNDKDLRAFMKDGDNLILIGELGKDIDASKWFRNLLQENSKEAEGIWKINPWGFKNRVKQYGKWDYKYASPANPNADVKQHILGIAFYRSDKEKGTGDLAATKFLFNGSKGRAQDLNNFHFGIVGKAYGLFTETFLLKKAGQAEMDKWADEGKQVPASWRPMIKVVKYRKDEFGVWEKYYEEQLGAPYGDNPIDHKWIKKGFHYYRKNSKS